MTSQTETILRELSSIESMFDIKHQETGRAINPRVFIIDSKFDLFEARDVVLNAIEKWIGLHPLLKSKIVKRNKEIENDSITKRYFAVASESLFQKLENVLFLENKGDLDNNAWQLLFENELYEPLDSTNGPLWRLKLLKIDQESDTKESFKYAVLFTAHHSITDGRNAYEIIKELLKMIEHENVNSVIPINQERQKLIEMETNYPDDPRFSSESIIGPYTPTSEIPTAILVPDYLKPQINNPIINKKQTKCIFRTHNGDIYITADDIQDKRNKKCSRFRIFSLESAIFTKLLQKCKKTNAKLTGCLEVVIALALQNVYRHFSSDKSIVIAPTYSVTTNLRPFLTPPADYALMGAWLFTLQPKIETLNKIDEVADFWSEAFWQLSKERTLSLHNSLKATVFFSKDTITQLDNYLHMFEKGFKVKDVNTMYAITNIGAVSSCAADSLNQIHIKEYYSGYSYTESEYWHLAFNSISSIDNRLSWCLSYNGYYIDDTVADYWIQSILDIISNVTKDN